MMISKENLKYDVTHIERPFSNGVVYFTYAEMKWIKNNVKNHEEFKCLWLLKKDFYPYCVIPLTQQDVSVTKDVAKEYTTAIINQLRGVKNEPIL